MLRCKIAKAAGLKTVLFICTGNAVRSQIAEALVNHFLKGKWSAFSAGTAPAAVNPYAVKIMKEIGIDISLNETKPVDIFMSCSFDRVVTLCSDADTICTDYPATVRKEHMPFNDPLSTYAFRFLPLSAFRELRDEIKSKILEYLGEGQ